MEEDNGLNELLDDFQVGRLEKLVSEKVDFLEKCKKIAEESGGTFLGYINFLDSELKVYNRIKDSLSEYWVG